MSGVKEVEAGQEDRLNGDALLRSGTMVVGEGTEKHEDSERVGEIQDLSWCEPI